MRGRPNLSIERTSKRRRRLDAAQCQTLGRPKHLLNVHGPAGYRSERMSHAARESDNFMTVLNSRPW